MNVSITGSCLVTSICSERLMNSLPTTIAGGLIEALAKEHRFHMLGRYREILPDVSSRNLSWEAYIMCTSGQLDSTDGVFAPYSLRFKEQLS